MPSWHHRLREQGHRVVSIGKLHFRGAPGDDNGFTEEILPMHIVERHRRLMGLVRDDMPVRKGGDKMAQLAGPGESQYTLYDREIAARAQVWLREEAPRDRDKPVGAVRRRSCAPHFPLIAPPEFYYTLLRSTDCRCRSMYDRRAAAASVPRATTRGSSTTTPVQRAERRAARARRLLRPRQLRSTRTSARCCARSSEPGSPTTRACSTRATTATTSARAGCGASRRCTRSRPACR